MNESDSTLQPASPVAALRRRRRSRPSASWTLALDVPRLTSLLWQAAAVLVALDLVASVGAAEGVPYTLTRFFDGDDKINVPTGFKTTTLLATTALLYALWALARRDHHPFERAWQLLGHVAAFAFVDETIYLHQSVGHVVHDHFHTHGVLGFAWVLVYAPALAALAVIMLQYVRHLADPLRTRLLVGGAVYGIGAVAFEPLKSEAAERLGEGGLAFKLTAAVSDSLEMIGLTMLVVVLLAELARVAGTIIVSLEPDTGGEHGET